MNTGLSAAREFWKTIAIREPRTPRMTVSSSMASGRPSKVTVPPLRRNVRGVRPRTDSIVSDLPLPVSPTIAVIVPRGTANVTSSRTGVYAPAGETKPP